MTLVFILDLDGTIIGDCIYQCELYKIYLILSKLGIKIKINDILESSYTEKSKLIRPYFSHFLQTISKNYPDSRFYIYTASEKKWGIKEIEIIEKNLGFKFDRPIFTRMECSTVQTPKKVEYRKSIDDIRRRIKIKEADFVIIDDKEVYLDNSDRLIKCSCYNYKYFSNYWDYIPLDKIKNKVFLNYLTTLITSKRLNPISSPLTMKNKIEYYKWLYDKCIEISKNNREYKNDDFWLRLTNIIIDNNINIFNESSIKFIKRMIKN